MLATLPHDTAVHSWCQLEASESRSKYLFKDAALQFWAVAWWGQIVCVCVFMCVVARVCVSMSVCLSGRLLCQAGEGVRNSSTDLGIKLMCWDQGPVPRKLSLWLKAIIRMGSEWALAPVMAQKPNTCLSPAPGPINTYISIYATPPLVVISVINNGPRWWDECPCFVGKRGCWEPMTSDNHGWDRTMVKAIILLASTWCSLLNLHLLLFISDLALADHSWGNL